jgi:uncharacterized protein YeeX (DUF496 family)
LNLTGNSDIDKLKVCAGFIENKVNSLENAKGQFDKYGNVDDLIKLTPKNYKKVEFLVKPMKKDWYPYLHITKDNFEFPSISPNWYSTSKNIKISDNTKRVLIFDNLGNYIDELVNVDNRKFSNSENLLPKIFDGSTFTDSINTIEDNFYTYYKKYLKYVKLRDRFKVNNVFDLEKKIGDFVDKSKKIKIFENRVPLMFQNEKFWSA